MVLPVSVRRANVLDELSWSWAGRLSNYVSRSFGRTLAYAADSSAVPLSFVKRTVRTLGKLGWTYALFARLERPIVQGGKHCVRVTVANRATLLRRSADSSVRLLPKTTWGHYVRSATSGPSLSVEQLSTGTSPL